MSRQEGLFQEAPKDDAPEGVKERSEDHDAPLLRWIEAETDGRHRMRVAKYRNGHRGLQFVRFAQDGRAEQSSSLLLHPDQYYQLAQCVFRDSQLIRELCTQFPIGTNEVVDKIRSFVNLHQITKR